MADEHEQLERSWIANADAWRDAVREQRIESRRAVTDAAIVDAVLSLHPSSVLDLGCGEGWLARALASHGITVTGIDASAPLINSARSLGRATFHVMRYEDVAALPRFDMTVANFSLLDDRTSTILRALPSDVVVIQTVCLDEPEDWRLETFASFEGHWPEPMPWYHRPRPSWLTLLAECGYDLLSAIDTTRSVIFTARRNGSN